MRGSPHVCVLTLGRNRLTLHFLARVRGSLVCPAIPAHQFPAPSSCGKDGCAPNPASQRWLILLRASSTFLRYIRARKHLAPVAASRTPRWSECRFVVRGASVYAQCATCGIEDEHALDHIFQLTHIARPVVLGQYLQRLFCNLHAWPSVLAPNSPRNSRASSGISCLRSRARNKKWDHIDR